MQKQECSLVHFKEVTGKELVVLKGYLTTDVPFLLECQGGILAPCYIEEQKKYKIPYTLSNGKPIRFVGTKKEELSLPFKKDYFYNDVRHPCVVVYLRKEKIFEHMKKSIILKKFFHNEKGIYFPLLALNESAVVLHKTKKRGQLVSFVGEVITRKSLYSKKNAPFVRVIKIL